MPLLSLIVTAYNIEDFLEECLQSVVGQTLTDMEIIVVDDGSSDRTPEIIRRFAAQDARIRPILLPENTIGGVASAANAGLDAATGTYIGFVDGDDFLAPEMFEKLVGAAQTYGTDLAMCRYMESLGRDGELREPAERMRWVRYSETKRVPLDRAENRISILRFIAVPWRKIYSRQMIEDNGIRFPVVDYFWEDNPFHWFTVCTAASIAVVPEVLCYHRVGRPGQTMDTRNADLIKMFGHYETIRAWLDERGILGEYHAPLLGWVISQFQWIHRRIPEDSGGTLFDVMAEIVQPVPQPVFEQALKEKRFTIRRQIRNIRAGDREAFLAYFNRQFRNRTGLPETLRARTEKPLSLARLAVGHLRANGLRPTLARAWQHLGGDRGLGNAFRRRNPPLSEAQMLKFLTLLQRDMDRKHAEISDRLAAIEDKIEEIRAGRDGD